MKPSLRNHPGKKKKAPNEKYPIVNPPPSPLSDDFEPGGLDVICGRGKGISNHEGNKLFSSIIRSNLQRYTEAEKRMDKSVVVTSIVTSLRQSGVRFVKYDKKKETWHDIGDDGARDKTGHAIRDLITSYYPGKSRKRRRSNGKEQMVVDEKEEASAADEDPAEPTTVVRSHRNQVATPEPAVVQPHNQVAKTPKPESAVPSSARNHRQFLSNPEPAVVPSRSNQLTKPAFRSGPRYQQVSARDAEWPEGAPPMIPHPATTSHHPDPRTTGTAVKYKKSASSNSLPKNPFLKMDSSQGAQKEQQPQKYPLPWSHRESASWTTQSRAPNYGEFPPLQKTNMLGINTRDVSSLDDCMVDYHSWTPGGEGIAAIVKHAYYEDDSINEASSSFPDTLTSMGTSFSTLRGVGGYQRHWGGGEGAHDNNDKKPKIENNESEGPSDQQKLGPDSRATMTIHSKLLPNDWL